MVFTRLAWTSFSTIPVTLNTLTLQGPDTKLLNSSDTQILALSVPVSTSFHWLFLAPTSLQLGKDINILLNTNTWSRSISLCTIQPVFFWTCISLRRLKKSWKYTGSDNNTCWPAIHITLFYSDKMHVRDSHLKVARRVGITRAIYPLRFKKVLNFSSILVLELIWAFFLLTHLIGQRPGNCFPVSVGHGEGAISLGLLKRNRWCWLINHQGLSASV